MALTGAQSTSAPFETGLNEMGVATTVCFSVAPSDTIDGLTGRFSDAHQGAGAGCWICRTGPSVVMRAARKTSASSELDCCLKVVEAFEQRDPIESAHNHLRSVEDEAYYYAGLAFGIVLASASVR